MRPNFLLLAISCVLLGFGTAHWTGMTIHGLWLALLLLGGVCAHASVNSINDYHDFMCGLDLKVQRTPFSGGSGSLVKNPAKAHLARITILVNLTITTAIGLYFIKERGWPLFIAGGVGMLTICFYTNYCTKRPVLCLLVPGIGFGTCMVMGTDFVLTGHYTWTAFVASLAPFFLVSNLLLLNQFPDAKVDREFGRKHFPILLGNKTCATIYGLWLLLAYLSIVAGVLFGMLPPLTLLGLLTAPLAVPAYLGARKYADNIPKIIPAMTLNVVINLATPVLMAIGLWLSPPL